MLQISAEAACSAVAGSQGQLETETNANQRAGMMVADLKKM